MPPVPWTEWMNDPDVVEMSAACTGLCYRLHWSNAPQTPPSAARIMKAWLSGERRAGVVGDLPSGETVFADVCAAIHALCARNPQLLPQARMSLTRAAQQLGETFEYMAQIGKSERDIALQVARAAASRAPSSLAQRAELEDLVLTACAETHRDALSITANAVIGRQDGARSRAQRR